MDMTRTLQVYIASPGDVVIERKIVREVCLGLNKSDTLTRLGISLKTEMWEDIFLPSSHAGDIIKKLSDTCDIFICIFYKRFDIRTERVASKTLNELFSSYDSWQSMTKPQFLFFFKEDEDAPNKNVSDDQCQKVSEFKKQIQSDGLFNAVSFSAPQEFCEIIYDEIQQCAVACVQSMNN